MTYFLGPCLVSWATKKQHSVAMSTVELSMLQLLLVVLNHCGYDNNSRTFVLTLGVFPYFVIIQVQLILPNPCQHKRTKHIDACHHFLRDNVEKGLISINFCATNKQIADIFTKALSRDQFERNMLELGFIKRT